METDWPKEVISSDEENCTVLDELKERKILSVEKEQGSPDPYQCNYQPMVIGIQRFGREHRGDMDMETLIDRVFT